MTHAPKVQVLIASIAAGKSTYARNAARQGFVVVSDDAIVSAVHGGVYSLYDKALKPLYKSVENHILSTAIALGRPVLIDRGVNLDPASRRRWVGTAHALDVPCEAVVFPLEAPEEHAARRARHDGRGHDYDYWLKVATAHRARYREPLPSEGFTRCVYVSFAQVLDGLVL